MNKRIRKKKMTQKRNASRKLILSMDDDIDKWRMLMLHVIRFGDYGFVREVIGLRNYLAMPRVTSKTLFYRWMLGYSNEKEVQDATN